MRESGGGLPKVQANGFEVHEPERGHELRAQVSMNLLDFAVTPLWLVWDSVRDLAAEDGVELAESELIGLAPQASFEAIAEHAGATDGSRSRTDSRPPRSTSVCATTRRCRSSSDDWTRPRQDADPTALATARG